MDRPFSIQARFVSKHMRHVQEDNDDDRHAEHVGDYTLHGTLHWLRAENPLCQRSCPPLYFSSISQVGGIGR